jgi:hypothetical protein
MVQMVPLEKLEYVVAKIPVDPVQWVHLAEQVE